MPADEVTFGATTRGNGAAAAFERRSCRDAKTTQAPAPPTPSESDRPAAAGAPPKFTGERVLAASGTVVAVP